MSEISFEELAHFGDQINDAADGHDAKKLLGLDLEAPAYCEAITPDFQPGAYPGIPPRWASRPKRIVVCWGSPRKAAAGLGLG
jgi:hypothetical protein